MKLFLEIGAFCLSAVVIAVAAGFVGHEIVTWIRRWRNSHHSDWH
jgi:hypothetical protein